MSTDTCLPTESQGRQDRATAHFYSVNSPIWLITCHQRKVTESEVRKKFTQIVLVQMWFQQQHCLGYMFVYFFLVYTEEWIDSSGY